MGDELKNIVVLKDLPSNLVEEAIVILKGDKKRIECLKKHIKNDTLKNKSKNIDKPKDYIVKEAQMVISNYISNIENQRKYKNSKKTNNNMEKKYRAMKIVSIIMFVALVINIL